MNLKTASNPVCEPKRPDSPVEEALKYLFDQVDRYDNHLGRLIDAVQQPQSCDAVCGKVPATYPNLREQIFKAAARLEEQNAILSGVIDNLWDELGNEKILK